MGAEQSTNRGASAAGTPAVQKTCYYELLGIERQAGEDEIKKAYRRKALELHPDRNYGDVENATRRFADVQTAYEILSDPQERAWYDSHRETILRGGDPTSRDEFNDVQNSTSAKDLISLISRFSPHMPFTDEPNGFYGSLRNTFQRLADEESIACDELGLRQVDYPVFGYANSDYDEVVRPFYNYWTGFGTQKTFAWKDEYRLSDAPDRRVRRLMEKENKRFREEGIRDFNDAVRTLVVFARKRDPRCSQNVQSDADRQKILREAAAAQAARARAENQRKLDQQTISDWAKTSHADDQVGDFTESEESEEEHYECMACNKTFKSEKQYEAHERSKKHVKVVQQLKRQMQKENKLFNLDETTPGDMEAEDPEAKPQENEEVSEAPEDQEDNDVAPGQEEQTSDISDSVDLGKPENPSLPIESASKETSEGDESPYEDDYVPREQVETRILGASGTALDNDQEEVAEGEAKDKLISDLASASLEDKSAIPKVGKAKAKRAKKAAQQQQADAQGSEFKCAACQESFPSKTKLFNHIKEEPSHAQPVSQSKNKKKGKKR